MHEVAFNLDHSAAFALCSLCCEALRLGCRLRQVCRSNLRHDKARSFGATDFVPFLVWLGDLRSHTLQLTDETFEQTYLSWQARSLSALPSGSSYLYSGQLLPFGHTDYDPDDNRGLHRHVAEPQTRPSRWRLRAWTHKKHHRESSWSLRVTQLDKKDLHSRGGTQHHSLRNLSK